MRRADPDLSSVYGTLSNKTAAPLPPIFGLMSGLAWGEHALKEQARNAAEAEYMNELFRRAEARRMAPVSEGFRSGRLMQAPSEEDEMVRMASAIGANLAVRELQKEAGIGALGGAALKGVGSVLGGVGRGLSASASKGMGALTGMGKGIMSGIKAAPGNIELGAWKARGGLANMQKNLGQRWGNFRQGMQQRGLARSYYQQRSAGRLQNAFERAGQRIESALGGTPTGTLSAPNIDPNARRAAAMQRMQRMQQKGIQPLGGQQRAAGRGYSSGRVLSEEEFSQEAAKMKRPAVQNSPPATTAPAPAGQVMQPPQGQGSPYRQPAAPGQVVQPTPQPQAGQAQGKVNPPEGPPQATPTQPSATTSQAGNAQNQPPQSTAQSPTAATGAVGQPAGTDPDSLGKKWEDWKQHSGLANNAWKWKLPALALGAAGTYGMYRAGQGALNYLGREGPPDLYGNPYAQPAAGINEWGNPQR